MKSVLASLLVFFFATSVGATTLKIKIQGYADDVRADDVYTYEGGCCSPIGSIQLDLDDPTLVLSPSLDFFRSDYGTAYYTEVGSQPILSGCDGLLSWLCWGTAAKRAGDMFESSSYFHFAWLNLTSFFFADDGLWGYTQGGLPYEVTNGFSVRGVVTSYQVSQVPLPASGFLLGGALLGAWAYRRRSNA